MTTEESAHLRKAQVEALKAEREGLVQRSESGDRKDAADRRVKEIDEQLDAFSEHPSRRKRETA